MKRITTPFGFSTTAVEVVQGVDLVGKRAIVTGGASGIGIETARALAMAGAAVTLAVRRPDAASVVAEEIRTSTGNSAVDVRPLDLADVASVRRFCADWTAALHILVNNAGIMALSFPADASARCKPVATAKWPMKFVANCISQP